MIENGIFSLLVGFPDYLKETPLDLFAGLKSQVLASYSGDADKLNARGEGDQAAFYLRKPEL